jgi:hypothetical protein
MQLYFLKIYLSGQTIQKVPRGKNQHHQLINTLKECGADRYYNLHSLFPSSLPHTMRSSTKSTRIHTRSQAKQRPSQYDTRLDSINLRPSGESITYNWVCPMHTFAYLLRQPRIRQALLCEANQRYPNKIKVLYVAHESLGARLKITSIHTDEFFIQNIQAAARKQIVECQHRDHICTILPPPLLLHHEPP